MTAVLIALGVASTLGLVFGLGWYFSEHQQRLRELRGVDVTRIADAVDGELVRIMGVIAEQDDVLDAPLSGRACVHFDVSVLEWRSHGKSGSFVHVFSETGSRPFVVTDASGRARIDTSHFRCAIVRDANKQSGTFNDASPEMEALLVRHGMQSTGLLGFNKSLRYEEGVLEPGERVTVLGRARWEDDPDETARGAPGVGYRDSVRRRRLVIEASLEPVRASDDPRVTGGDA